MKVLIALQLCMFVQIRVYSTFVSGTFTNKHIELLLFSFKMIEYKIKGINFGNIQQELESKLEEGVFASEGGFAFLKAIKQMLRLRELMTHFMEVGINTCRAIITNRALVEELQEEKFDAALLSDMFIARCLHLIPQRLLHLPYASFGEFHSPWDMRLPVLPVHFIGQEVSSPTFGDRIHGLVQFIMLNALNAVEKPPLPDDWAEIINETETNVNVIAQRATIFLYYYDEILTGHVLPKLPHMEFLAALTASPPKPIKDTEIAEWANNSNNGFVLCSFGSLIAAFKPTHLEKLFNLFENLKLPVIMRLKANTIPFDIAIPKNVLIREWLPQNDLLGHPNIRLFISHGGTNGISESLYHGVPIIALPFASPQRFITDRIEAQGYKRDNRLYIFVIN